MSLASEGFELLGTIKVPALAGKIANNMPLLIKESAYTAKMISKIKSDAGDLRYTVNPDGTGRLPIDLVADNITDVWTKLPSVAINNLIYVWGNKPTAVKEIDTATYGKHIVWSDYSLAIHGQYDALDSSGNATPIFNGNNTPVYDSEKGLLAEFQTKISYVVLTSTSMSVTSKIEVVSFDDRLFSNNGNNGFVVFSTRRASGHHSPTLCYSDNGFRGSAFFHDTNATAIGTSNNTIGITTPYNVIQKGTFDLDAAISDYGGTWRVYLDGTKVGENNTPSNQFTINNYGGEDWNNEVLLGGQNDWNNYATLYMRDTLIKKFPDTEDYSSIESSNQNATDGWWIPQNAEDSENNNVNGTASDNGHRLDFTVAGGNGYATSPTLGYLLNLNTIRCESDSVYLPMNSPSGYIWGQAVSDSSDREFGVFFYSGSPSIRIIIGGQTTTNALTEAEVIAEYGSNVITGTLSFEIDMSTGGYAFYHNGISFKTGTATLGNNSRSGTNFNIGARSDSNTGGDTSGGFIAPALWKIGNTRIYLDGILTRNFVSDGVGSTWEEIENNQDALLQGFPTDGTQWEIYGTISGDTNVNSDLSNLWSKNILVNSDLSNLWSKLSISSNTDVNSDLSNLWSKNILVNSDLSNLWSKNIQVNGDLSNLWSKNILVNSDLSNLWSKNILVNGTLSTAWSKNILVNSDLSNLWSKNILIETDLSNLWSKNILVNSDLSNSWSKLSIGAISTTLSTAWSKNILIENDLSNLWSKNILVNSDLSNSWSKNILVNGDLSNLWSKNILIENDLSNLWSKNILVNSNLSNLWSKISTGSVNATLSTAWSKNILIEKDLSNLWSKLSSVIIVPSPLAPNQRTIYIKEVSRTIYIKEASRTLYVPLENRILIITLL